MIVDATSRSHSSRPFAHLPHSSARRVLEGIDDEMSPRRLIDTFMRRASTSSASTSFSSFARWSSSAASPQRRFAVVGSGPAGMYAALELPRAFPGARVDVFDRSPAPFGLVRYGVAPDHAETKLVTNKFHETLTTRDDVRFFGNVELGTDVSLGELYDSYHGVVLACGTNGDRLLDVPGESENRGVVGARAFVAWFNGDPEHGSSSATHFAIEEALINREDAHVAVIGVGNVALDCARILLKDAEALAGTDICEHALEVLRANPVRSVSLIGRRGVAQASFSPKELRELLNLPRVRVVMSDESLELAAEDELELKESRPRRRAYEAFVKRASEGECATAGGCAKTLHVRFRSSPLAFGGDAGALRWMKLGRNEIVGEPGARKSVSSGETETVPTALALRSVGYAANPIEMRVQDTSASALRLPFDGRRRVVPNRFGAVTRDASSDAEEIPRLYVTGWLKRGATGIIGTNLTCAEETIAKMSVDFAENPPSDPIASGVDGLLSDRGIRVVSARDWSVIDALERGRGADRGKPREKFVSIDDFIKALDDAT